MFVDPGYAATPLTAVAAEAGVAVQTLYAVFGSKRQLLSELVDVTLVGDDEPVAMPDRPFAVEIRALTDPRAKLARYARHIAEVHARQVQVMLALAGAATADADAAEIWRKNIDERRFGMACSLAELVGTGALSPDLDVEQVADILWLAQDVRNYDWLVCNADGRPISTSAGTSTASLASSSPAPDHSEQSAPTYEMLATLHLPADQVVQRLGTAPGDVQPIDEHSCRLHGRADTLEWLASRLLLLGCEFQVHEPPELLAYLRAAGARAIRAAGGPTESTAYPRTIGMSAPIQAEASACHRPDGRPLPSFGLQV